MTHVRRRGGDRLLVGIERKRNLLPVAEPPIAIESFFELGGAPPILLRVVLRAHDPPQHRHELLRGEPVRLQLTGAEWRMGRRAVFVDDSVAGVFPTLVLRAHGRSRQVFLVAIAVAIAIRARPVENPPRSIPMARQHRALTIPGIEMREPDDEHEWTREVTVVPAKRGEIEAGEWAGANLLYDPAGLFIAPRVVLPALETGQPGEGVIEARTPIEHRRLPAACERVSTEQRGI